MAIGTPVNLGVANQASAVGATLAITTLADAPLDSLIVVASHGGSDNELDAITGARSGYSLGTFVQNGTRRTRFAYSSTGALVSTGASLTGDFGSATGVKLLNATAVTGVKTTSALLEQSSSESSVSGTTTTPTHTTGSLAAGEKILIAYIFVLLASSDLFTEDAANGWTSINYGELSGASAGAMRMAYKTTSSAGTQTYAPTLGTARNWSINVMAFDAIPAAGGIVGDPGSLAFFGVG